MSGMVLIARADALGSRAGNPPEGSVPQRSLLLCLALSHPSPAAWSAIPYAPCGYMWCGTRVRTFVTHSPVSDVGREISEPAPHLAAPSFHESVEHQCPAPGWNRDPGRMLWFPAAPEGLEGLQPTSVEYTGSHVSLTWPKQTGCPLPVTQAAAGRLRPLRAPWFIRHLGEPGIL